MSLLPRVRTPRPTEDPRLDINTASIIWSLIGKREAGDQWSLQGCSEFVRSLRRDAGTTHPQMQFTVTLEALVDLHWLLMGFLARANQERTQRETAEWDADMLASLLSILDVDGGDRALFDASNRLLTTRPSQWLKETTAALHDLGIPDADVSARFTLRQRFIDWAAQYTDTTRRPR